MIYLSYDSLLRESLRGLPDRDYCEFLFDSNPIKLSWMLSEDRESAGIAYNTIKQAEFRLWRYLDEEINESKRLSRQAMSTWLHHVNRPLNPIHGFVEIWGGNGKQGGFNGVFLKEIVLERLVGVSENIASGIRSRVEMAINWLDESKDMRVNLSH